jgi:hypothetical protein
MHNLWKNSYTQNFSKYYLSNLILIIPLYSNPKHQKPDIMKKLLFFTVVFLCSTLLLKSQTVLVAPANDKIPKNFIKTNITSILIKNYSIQYERALNKSISFGISFRIMPTTGLPFKSQILKQVGPDDPDAEDMINSLTISNYAVTPELRFYLGKKGYGRGFYIAPFYRYSSYEAANVAVNFDTDENVQRSIDLSGNITAHTAGLMFGAQWALSKHICLDWWILGPHYGVSSGALNGIPSPALSTDEQAEIRQNLEDIDIPLVKKTVAVSANKVEMTIDGPWAGLRAGISIGFRF